MTGRAQTAARASASAATPATAEQRAPASAAAAGASGAVPAQRTSESSFYGRTKGSVPDPSAPAANPPGSTGAAGAGAAKRSGSHARIEAKLGMRAKSSLAAAKAQGRGPKPLVVPKGSSAFEAAFGGVVGQMDVRDCSTRCGCAVTRVLAACSVDQAPKLGRPTSPDSTLPRCRLQTGS